MRSNVLQIHPADTVAVAIKALSVGTSVQVGGLSIVISDGIPAGHKFAIRHAQSGADVLKYGFPIGRAESDIQPGQHVHTHNLRTRLRGTEEYSHTPVGLRPAPEFLGALPKTFAGFPRANGDAGVRNEIWIVPTVGCVNSIASALADAASKTIPNGSTVEGVVAFPHPYGCSQLGEDHERTRHILAGLAEHPNAGGVMVVGLGCENNLPGQFRELLGDFDSARIQFLVAQDVGDEFSEGMRIIRDLMAHAGKSRRTEVPVSALRVGLKCGGSDGFSGITGNPLLGVFSDSLCAMGGTTVLTEVPEMFGAESVLMERCESSAVFDRCVNMVNGFKEYFIRHNQQVYENPSPGNKKGGITTLEEKSLGCVQKGGSSPVVDVIEYGGRLRLHGLNLLDGPGNDIVASTALVAAGAHLILFTTGRGTPLGSPVPVVKVSTNSSLATRKPGWIDFDAGPLLDGEPMEAMAVRFFQQVVDTASGRIAARNIAHGFREIAIFKDGVTL